MSIPESSPWRKGLSQALRRAYWPLIIILTVSLIAGFFTLIREHRARPDVKIYDDTSF